jgi:hypothetical protein
MRKNGAIVTEQFADMKPRRSADHGSPFICPLFLSVLRSDQAVTADRFMRKSFYSRL